MTKTWIAVACCACLAAAGQAAELLPPPNPKPFAEVEQLSRQAVAFEVGSFPWRENGTTKLYEQPSFVVGNKAVCVRRIGGRYRPTHDQCVSIYVDNKEAGRFAFWGSFQRDGTNHYGFPFEAIENDPAELVVDKQSQTLVYQKPYLNPDGKRTVFSYTLRSLEDSKVEFTWDLGLTQEEFAKLSKPYGVSPWFTMEAYYQDYDYMLDGKPFTPASAEDFKTAKKVSTGAAGDFVFAASDPAKRYAILYGDMVGTIQESYQNGRFSFINRSRLPKPGPTGKIVLDLGEAEVRQAGTPPPVGGIDFWKLDGTHVPVSPVRNLMPNPSFEQGMRYWRWIQGGAHYDPADQLRYDIVPQGRFGKNALIMRNTQRRSPGLRSFPMSLDKGQTYTLSFYAKADRACQVHVALKSAARGGKFESKYGPFGDSKKVDIGTEWKRYSRTFTADGAGLHVLLSGNNNTLLDGLQLEKGPAPTEFVAPPADGLFTTRDPDNALVKGQPIGAAFTVAGKPGTTGNVTVSVINAFRERVATQTLKVNLPDGGVQTEDLKLDPAAIGEGVFVVRAEYAIDGAKPYSETFRFSVMEPLSNTHETKDIFGLIMHIRRIGRGEDYAKKLMEWGFGSTSWGFPIGPDNLGMRANLEKKYRIANYVGSAMPFRGKDADILRTYRTWTEVTPELEKRIEQAAYEKVKQYDPERYDTWAFANEEESSYLPGHKLFDEYFKAQFAAARGAKRANPNAKITPTNGTSGYNRLRGYAPMEGYLKAAQKAGFKYDAISVHPYGSVDKGTLGGNDLDEETARLIEQMKRYGYGKETPIYYTEMFNVPEAYIPSWGADGSYDAYQGGKPTYDFGNREFIQACSLARVWIICMKYWPQVRSTNVWVAEPFMDYNLTPLLMCKVANTLGHHLPYVEYQADIKPAAGIRGYAFKLKDGSGIAPVWCVDHDVENGLQRGPVIQANFGQDVEIYDLMGNRRAATTNAKGVTTLQLTPAPLLVKARDVALLTKALQNAWTTDSKSALQVSMQPSLDGTVQAVVKNLTGRTQTGTLTVAGKSTPYSIQPDGERVVEATGAKQDVQFGKMFRWNHPFRVKPTEGAALAKEWKMDYFYVPKSEGMPDWNTIPAIPITNRYLSKNFKGETPANDQSATFKMAWDQKNLYLRVEATDDQFLTFPQHWKRTNADQALYVHDGCLEVYFDTGANGRTNHEQTFDLDDYRYDFSIGKSGTSGSGMVYRLREVNHQLADGVNMATKEEAAKNIQCHFQRTDEGYAYTITFAQRYLEPLMLREGFISGFALYVHDTDGSVPVGCPKGLSLATEPGSHCDNKPQLWPLMILAK
jgi:hypothetical protein